MIQTQNIKKMCNNQQGFTLLELLLVVGLTATLIIGFGRLSSLWANRQLAELSGVHMQKITEIVENYIRINAPNPGTLIDNTDITAEIAAQLPTGMTMRNPLRQDLRVRLNITPPPNVEYQAVIYTDGAVAYDKLLPAARSSGASGGYASNILTPSNIAESAFGLWTTDLTVNFGLPFGAPPTDADDDAGYLVSYLSLSLEEAFGPYLYRNDVGDPDRNTMFTDLNMNGNAIRAVGEMDVNDLEVETSATIQQLQVDGDTTFVGSVDIGGTLNVDDQIYVVDDLTLSQGDLIVGDGSAGSGNIDAATVNVNTVNASVVNAPDISATNISVSADATLASDLIVSGSVLADGEIQANTLNANELNAVSAQTDEMTVNNNVTVNGDAVVNGAAVVEVLTVDDCVTIQPGGINDQYGPNC